MHPERLKQLYSNFSIIPLNDKVPIWNDWTKHKEIKPTFDSLKLHDGNFGIVCGYEGLEVIDIDNHFLNADALFAWIKDNFDLTNFLITKTQHNGYHIYFKSDYTEGSFILAKRQFEGTGKKGILPDGKEIDLREINGKWYTYIAMVETRGIGGQVVFYDNILQGSLDSIPVLDQEQRSTLIEICRALNEVAEKEAPKLNEKIKIEGQLPGDLYNNDPNAIEETFNLLKEAGWTTNDNIHWWRPGKNFNQGPSATFGKVGINRFYNFSSNGYPFDFRVSNSLFGVRTILKHEGNFKKCAKELAKLYNIKPNEPKKKKSKWDVLHAIIEEWKLKFRYNELTTVVDVSRNGSQFDRLGLLLGDIIKEMETKRGIASISKSKLDEMINNSHTCEVYNPIKKFFGNLPGWDGKDSFTEITKYIKLDPDESEDFFISMLKKQLIRAVKCGLIANYVNRMSFILYGPQEIGKSEFFRWLMPEKDLYNEEPIDPTEKDSILALSRYLVINMDDIDGLSKREVSKLKAYTSRSKITKRVSYGRHDEKFNRIGSLFGSTNRSDILADENNTRWLILKVIDFDWKGYVADIDPLQLWAQAKYLLEQDKDAGELTKEEKKIRDSRNEAEFLEISSEREILMKYFEEGTQPLTATDIKYIIETKKYPLKVNMYQLTRELKRLFGQPSKPKRENGKQGRYYYLKCELLNDTAFVGVDEYIESRSEVPF